MSILDDHAKARLLAAAPNMLATLQALMDEIEDSPDEFSTWVIKEVRDAIDKAEGLPPDAFPYSAEMVKTREANLAIKMRKDKEWYENRRGKT